MAVTYRREDLEASCGRNRGSDFGTLMEHRAAPPRVPPGGSPAAGVVGSERTVVGGERAGDPPLVSKSPSVQLAFIVTCERDRAGVPTTIRLQGAGWGHGVGLCQIGAAVMAVKGFFPRTDRDPLFPGGGAPPPLLSPRCPNHRSPAPVPRLSAGRSHPGSPAFRLVHGHPRRKRDRGSGPACRPCGDGMHARISAFVLSPAT